MKKMQKIKLLTIIGASVLTVALVVSIVLLLVKNVGKTVIKIESQNAIPGDEISMPITVDKNHGLFLGQIVIKYDSSALEFVSCANGNVFDGCDVNAVDVKDTVYIIAEHTGLENTETNGVIATLTFRVKPSAKQGTYPISFYLPETVEEGTYFANIQDAEKEKWIVPKCIDGKIIVQ